MDDDRTSWPLGGDSFHATRTPAAVEAFLARRRRTKQVGETDKGLRGSMAAQPLPVT
ncbi:hypothetical protein [Actinocorallia libanotica]|uniref:Uncharacterized protein n=1 Tax=Actinocorallia libanotica TaxID=46162 RepID=A0ABN1QKG2_9ACTN